MIGKIKMICEHCGSDDVGRDAVAYWDVDEQEWTLGSVYDHSFCNSCGREKCLEEVEVND